MKRAKDMPSTTLADVHVFTTDASYTLLLLVHCTPRTADSGFASHEATVDTRHVVPRPVRTSKHSRASFQRVTARCHSSRSRITIDRFPGKFSPMIVRRPEARGLARPSWADGRQPLSSCISRIAGTLVQAHRENITRVLMTIALSSPNPMSPAYRCPADKLGSLVRIEIRGLGALVETLPSSSS